MSNAVTRRMPRWLAPLPAALLLVLGGCAQDDLGLAALLAEDVIYDAPKPVAQSAPPPLVANAAWSTVVRADGAPVAPAATNTAWSMMVRPAAGAQPPPPPVTNAAWGAVVRPEVAPAPTAPVKQAGWSGPRIAPESARMSPPVVPWGKAAVVPYLPPPGVSGLGPYFLNTGDKLRVFVYGQPSLSRLYTVDQAGNIAVPLIGNVKARQRTATQLARVIADRLGRDFVRDPQVTVDVAQNRPFFILGEVRLPGQYPYVSGMTVETAVAIAGGYTERASERRFRITRRLGPLVDQIEAPGDYTLLPGDTVYVFERFL